MDMKDTLLSTTALVDFFGVSRETIRNWRTAGMPFIRLGASTFRYRLEDLEKWFGTSFEELEKYI